MTVFFRDANIRSALKTFLESTFGFGSELNGVPSDYAFALATGTPALVAETFFKPWLTDFIRMAYTDFKSRTEAERIGVIQRMRDEQLEGDNVLDVFLTFCVDSYSFYTESDFNIPSHSDNQEEDPRVQISEIIFKDYSSLSDDFGNFYPEEEDYSVGSLVFGAVYCLSDFLNNAALTVDSSLKLSRPDDKITFLGRFTATFDFYADTFRSYQSFASGSVDS